MSNGRRARSRKGGRKSPELRKKVELEIHQEWSPEQISGRFKRDGIGGISHETIYRWIWDDKASGGTLWRNLRGAKKQRRKRYRSNDSRGRLADKTMIEERPKRVEARQEQGHWEIDTVHGKGKHSVVTLVERATGYALVGKIKAVTKAETNARVIQLMRSSALSFQTITSDNGGEFHGYKELERKTGVKFYFANPYHSWERGTNENFNGLLRQYLPKGKDLTDPTQRQCGAIVKKLNNRPRKRYQYASPSELLNPDSVALST